MHADILIVGGGTGGTAAALAAAGRDLTVIMTEETDWIGGQLTAQCVPPDEHPWIEQLGCTARYRSYRDRVREHYEPGNRRLNPGGGWVSRLCHEPRVGVAVLEAMMPSEVTILRRHKPISATVEGDRVTSVTLWNLDDDSEITITARFVLDATESGELLPLTGTEYRLGAESKAETGEQNAVDGPAEPDNIQGLTWCFAMCWNPGGASNLIEKPRDYEKWRAVKPDFWPGPLLGFQVLNAHTGEPNELPLFRDDGVPYALFTYRQITPFPNELREVIQETKGNEFRDIVLELWAEEPWANRAVTIVNWPQNDYFAASILDVDPPGSRSRLPGASGLVSEARLLDAKQLSLSLLYWLQTEAPRHDGGVGYPELALAPDITDTEDGFAKYPYLREGRRIEAMFTVKEQDVSFADNQEAGKARELPQSVGIGAYRIDLHPSTNGRNMIDTSTYPFQIPLGALVPVRMKNLIPAARNIGVTHITNGCYRLHPVEWNIGEVAGLLATFCLERGGVQPWELLTTDTFPNPHPQTAELLFADFAALLEREGIERSWPQFRAL